MNKLYKLFLLPICLALAGCSATPSNPPTLTATSLPATATSSATPTRTSEPTVTATTTPSPTPDPTAGFSVSSPLQDITLAELHEIISGPFEGTSPGWDDGHHGVDFSYYSRGSHLKMEGLEIYSMLPGKVAGITVNRERYGNMIMIETPLRTIPADFLELLSVPSQATPFPYNSRLIDCESLKEASWTEDISSLYLLYAHLKDPTILQIGEQVTAGQLIGLVGNTGASGNPHLHLEMRWGPGGIEFASMSHYDGKATPQERLEWCNWRISGRFVLFDPMQFINSWLAGSNGS